MESGGAKSLVAQALRLGDIKSESDPLLLGPAEMEAAFDELPEEDRQVLLRTKVCECDDERAACCCGLSLATVFRFYLFSRFSGPCRKESTDPAFCKQRFETLCWRGIYIYIHAVRHRAKTERLTWPSALRISCAALLLSDPCAEYQHYVYPDASVSSPSPLSLLS